MANPNLYPHVNELCAAAAAGALQLVQEQLRDQTWSFCTREDLLEAATDLTMRLDYLWENGGRDEFDAMIERDLGRAASHGL